MKAEKKLTLFFASALVACAAAAQSTYPAKPVTMVVAFPPGGAADIIARVTQPYLQDVLKQPVIILNKAGAGGSLGTASVATAAPDGYTVLMALTSIATNPEADRINGRKPAFELNQLQPIAQISADPFVLMVRADSSYKTIQNLVEDARKRPGSLTYGSSGNYGTSHVATESLASAAGIKLLHVPYGGGAPTLTALLGGQVDFVPFAPGVAIPHVKSGKLRPLATFGPTRLAALPDVPTLKEAGYDSQYLIITGVFVPASTPPQIASTLRNAFRAVAANPEFRAKMETAGAPAAYLDAPEFSAAFDAEAKRLNVVLKRIGKLE